MADGGCRILDGKSLAAALHAEIRARVEQEMHRRGRPPGLAVILVGDNPASQAYVAGKERTAKQKCGFRTFNAAMPAHSSAEEIRRVIEGYNRSAEVDGILLQLPLPKHLDSAPLLNLILPQKDADGLHPFNQGLLMRGMDGLRPCTPSGVLKLIDLAYALEGAGPAPERDLSGKRALVIGRSILVGKPVALMLLQRNATVTLAHSRSPDLAGLCRQADIIVAAVGAAGLVRGDWVSPGAVVIDVGMNRTAEGTLTGDVVFDELRERCAALTPVPGGVGPMTVAMLMYNTLQAYLAGAAAS